MVSKTFKLSQQRALTEVGLKLLVFGCVFISLNHFDFLQMVCTKWVSFSHIGCQEYVSIVFTCLMFESGFDYGVHMLRHFSHVGCQTFVSILAFQILDATL